MVVLDAVRCNPWLRQYYEPSSRGQTWQDCRHRSHAKAARSGLERGYSSATLCADSAGGSAAASHSQSLNDRFALSASPIPKADCVLSRVLQVSHLAALIGLLAFGKLLHPSKDAAA
jgi:acetyl esterase/lipase